jgi:hypothetical protein
VVSRRIFNDIILIILGIKPIQNENTDPVLKTVVQKVPSPNTNNLGRIALAEYRPATPIAKRLRQRNRNGNINTTAQPRMTDSSNIPEKSSLLTLAEGLRSKLLVGQAIRSNSDNIQIERNNTNPQIEPHNSSESSDSISIEIENVKPKMKLLFEDEELMQVIGMPEEIQDYESSVTATTIATTSSKIKTKTPSPKRKLSEVDTEVNTNEDPTIKKRNKSSLEFNTPEGIHKDSVV